MPNSLDRFPDKTVDSYTANMHKEGSISRCLDTANKGNDILFGKRDLPKSLKSIDNKAYVEMKKMQSDIPGFRK